MRWPDGTKSIGVRARLGGLCRLAGSTECGGTVDDEFHWIGRVVLDAGESLRGLCIATQAIKHLGREWAAQWSSGRGVKGRPA